MTGRYDDVLARLEAYQDDPRELDARIILAAKEWTLHEETTTADFRRGHFAAWMGTTPGGHNCTNVSAWPYFTTKVGHALQLKPVGYDYGFSFTALHGLEVWCRCDLLIRGICHQGYAPEGDKTDDRLAHALCIAFVSARNESLKLRGF